MKFIVTGCGRSGTGYFARISSKAGIECGHENVYSYKLLQKSSSDLIGESSWYAPGYYQNIPESTHIIHLVRDPLSWFCSYYRIGLLSSPAGWVNIFQDTRATRLISQSINNGSYLLQRAKKAKEMRRFLRQNCICMAYSNEIDRIWKHWSNWNQLIEKRFKDCYPYKVIKTQDLSYASIVQLLSDVTGKRNVHLSIHDGLTEQSKNHKGIYFRKPLDNVDVPAEVIDLALKYGYSPEKFRVGQ